MYAFLDHVLVKMRAFIALLLVAAVSAKAPLYANKEPIQGKYILKVKVIDQELVSLSLFGPARATYKHLIMASVVLNYKTKQNHAFLYRI